MIKGENEMENFCVMCGDIIPEGRTVCPNCENTIFKMGALLQSKNAPKEDIDGAYDTITYIKTKKQNKMIEENIK